jgi:acyl-CoA thioesterase-1
MPPELDSIKARIKSPEPITWLITGDSITHGIYHTMGWRDYELFHERVRWEMLRVRDCVIKTAITGWKITDLRDALEWNVLRHRPDIVSINVGMNDCVQGDKELAEFERVYSDVVKSIREKTGALVILHTPNRILPNDADRAAYLSSYAESVRHVAMKTGAVLVDHFDAWKVPEADGSIWLLLNDAIHPNEFGHRFMYRTLLQTLGIWDENSLTGKLLIPKSPINSQGTQ